MAKSKPKVKQPAPKLSIKLSQSLLLAVGIMATLAIAVFAIEGERLDKIYPPSSTPTHSPRPMLKPTIKLIPTTKPVVKSTVKPQPTFRVELLLSPTPPSTPQNTSYKKYLLKQEMESGLEVGGGTADRVCNCIGYRGPGGPCYDGPGGPAYDGPGGPAYSGPGGPCYDGPGGPAYDGPGGPAYDGPGGPAYDGPGGPAYSGPGGPAYDGPGGPCYTGPGGPCYTGPGGGVDCPKACSL